MKFELASAIFKVKISSYEWKIAYLHTSNTSLTMSSVLITNKFILPASPIWRK